MISGKDFFNFVFSVSGDIDFGRKDWATARDTVDAVLELLFKEVRSGADKFEGLKIERYVRQGSSREGLKVIAPDEFDTLLLYHFENIFLSPKDIETESNKIIPEFCKMTCNRSLDTVKARLPTLFRKGVFKELAEGTVCLNSRALHQQVFQSIIDQVTDKIRDIISDLEIRGQRPGFQISRIMNPPSINLTIHMTNGKNIDVDVVPGLLLREDQVPDPARPGQTMDCPVYAVFRWAEQRSMKGARFNDADIVWRICSSGYEKHTADVARCRQQERYIITALRILKTYFSKTKRSGNSAPPQIVTVLRSYHLKHIAYYILLHTQYIYKIKFKGVQEVLLYFFRFLRTSLERKRLPHFFHSNTRITYMYPNYPVNHNALRFNLLGQKSDEALKQALLSLDHHLIPNLGYHLGGSEEDHMRERITTEYSQHISVGEYF